MLQIKNTYFDLKKKEKLINYNGNSLLSYSTNVGSVLNAPHMHSIRDGVISHCLNYFKLIDVEYDSVSIIGDWVIGYEKDQYQGEHNHGYESKDFSGVIYASVPKGSSPLMLHTPNPYGDHAAVCKTSSVSIAPSEGMIILFPSFLRHNILPNFNTPAGSLRLALAFNICVG